MLAPEEIQRRLAAYLDARLGRLAVLASGWETTVFEFVLASVSHRFSAIPVGQPLVLRFYQSSDAAEKGRREHLTMDRLSANGMPVAQPYVFEADPDAIGAPFLVMERLDGGPLFSTRSFPQAFKTFSLGFFSFVQTQARLHKLDPKSPGLRDIPRTTAVAGDPPDGPLLDRLLRIIDDRVERGPLPGMRNALARISKRAPHFRNETPSLVHMDYHPQNAIVKGFRVTGIIDWVKTDVGDRHLDAATTAVILSSSAFEHPRWMRDNLIGNTLRASFASIYLPLYHAMAPMDFERFRYCQAVAAVLRLSMLGMMSAQGAETVGFRPEAIAEVTPGVVRLLSRYATRKSGTAVGVEIARPQIA
jgi:aminoglycoside phosphotransferase (APT) family kinase protein